MLGTRPRVLGIPLSAAFDGVLEGGLLLVAAPFAAFDGALDGGLLLIVPSAAFDGTLDGALDGGLLLITPSNRSRSP